MKNAPRTALAAAVTLSFCLASLPQARAGHKPPPPATDTSDGATLAAIQRGVDFLFAHRNGDHWNNADKYAVDMPGGADALILHSLLNARKIIDDPRLNPASKELKPAVEWLAGVEPTSAYVAAYQAIVFSEMPEKLDPDHAALKRAAHYLKSYVTTDGAYGYNPARKAAWDNSNSRSRCWAPGPPPTPGRSSMQTSGR